MGGAFSPDGRKLAFTAFDLKLSTKGPSKGTYTSDPAKLYVLDLDSGVAAVPLLNRNNMGEAQNSSLGFREPSWSPDGTYIVFSARGGKSNKPPCGSGNTDIFIIRSDGTGQATSLTRTDTTSKEQWPQWGW